VLALGVAETGEKNDVMNEDPVVLLCATPDELFDGVVLLWNDLVDPDLDFPQGSGTNEAHRDRETGSHREGLRLYVCKKKKIVLSI
jgi:hypothetical protein